MELLSIIVPVYNVEKYLERCIQTIIDQTYKNIEIIIVDDGSTDNSGVLCDQIAGTDLRIRVIHTRHLGTSNARNVGIQNAGGNYIGFVDSDDYIAADMYERMLRYMDKNVDIVCCGRRCINPPGTKNVNYCCMNSVQHFSGKESVREVLLLQKISFSVCTKLFRRELFENITFPKGRTCEDLPVTYALLKKSRTIVHIGEAKYFNCYRDDSTSRQDFFAGKIASVLFARDILEDVKTNFPEFEKEAEARYVKNALVILQSINKSDNADLFKKMRKRLQKSLRRMIGRELVNPYIPKVYKEILFRNALFAMNAKDYQRI